MNYFVTGATGFLGRFLVEKLAERGTVYLLMRRQSQDKFDGLVERLEEQKPGLGKKLVPIWGDLTRKGLATSTMTKPLIGKIDHVFHLGAVYDMGMSDAVADQVNNEGTRNVVEFTNSLAKKPAGKAKNARIKTPTLHHVSSVAVAGSDFEGKFTESMFDEGQTLDHPYYRTKYQSEAIVRDECVVPWRVYRPGMVLGHSETGEIDKIDGPYYFFKAIKQIRDRVPKWLPLPGVDGGTMPLAPVDYVVNAMDYLAHKTGLDGRAFHLAQTPPPTLGEVMETLFAAAHGPELNSALDANDIPDMPDAVAEFAERIPGLDAARRGLARKLSEGIGIPVSVFGYVRNQCVFDDQATRTALKGSGISCPKLADYAETLWQYWEQYLDVDTDIDPKLISRVKGKTVLVTGASSGIGLNAVKKLAAGGATVLLVARTESKLLETQAAIQRMGGVAHVYPCDLNDMEAISAMAEKVLADHGHVDVLINNAGRSIRRSVRESLDRFHDYERTMQLNYFGAVRLITAILPSMTKRKKGQIINISSIGCLANVPRFSAYVASKSALDAFSRCLSAEIRDTGVDITTIYMPLVRTPMIAPTKHYDYIPVFTPDQAGNMIVKAVVERPKRLKTALGKSAELSYAIWPKLNDFVLSQGYALFPSSAAARGGKDAKRPSFKSIAFATLTRGAHW